MNSDAPTEAQKADVPPAGAGKLRAAIAGVLMGIANLIPGVSGGTMILAMGVYEEFIDSVAEITSLRFRWRRIVFLAIVGGGAVASIVLLAGVILYLLFHHLAAMYALFIGLTLGGAPLLARSLRPVRADAVVATLAGLVLMVGIVLLKSGGKLPYNMGMDFVDGVVGATTMVLPGISGSYMLLVMGQYERVVGAVSDMNLRIIVPVGVGAVLGIIGLSNLLKILLHRFHRPTVGVLLGILLGSVLGLWPFGQEPSEKALERQSPAALRAFAQRWQIPGVSQIADAQLATYIDANWKSRARTKPSAREIAAVIALIAAGFAATYALSRRRAAAACECNGKRPDPPEPAEPRAG